MLAALHSLVYAIAASPADQVTIPYLQELLQHLSLSPTLFSPGTLPQEIRIWSTDADQTNFKQTGQKEGRYQSVTAAGNSGRCRQSSSPMSAHFRKKGTNYRLM